KRGPLQAVLLWLRVPGGVLAEVGDRDHAAAAVRALVVGGDRHEHRLVTGDRSGHAADGGLDLAVPGDVRGVHQSAAASADHAVLGGLALQEHVDETALDVRPVRALRQVDARVADGVPDAVGVERVLHHGVTGAVAAADAPDVADDDDLRLVELHARRARRDRRVQVEVLHDLVVGRHAAFAERHGDAQSGGAVGQLHRLERVVGPHGLAAAVRVTDGVHREQRGLGLHVVHVGDIGDAGALHGDLHARGDLDRKSTRLNSSHVKIAYAVFCL